MKRFLVLVLLGLCANLHAEAPPKVGGHLMPSPGQFVSEDVYYSSSVCTGNDKSNVFVSTVPALLDHINVSSVTVGYGYFQVFDGQVTTSTARVVSGKINTATAGTWPFKVGISSGLGVAIQNVTGGPGCVDIFYRER